MKKIKVPYAPVSSKGLERGSALESYVGSSASGYYFRVCSDLPMIDSWAIGSRFMNTALKPATLTSKSG